MSVNSSEINGKSRTIGPSPIKKTLWKKMLQKRHSVKDAQKRHSRKDASKKTLKKRHFEAHPPPQLGSNADCL